MFKDEEARKKAMYELRHFFNFKLLRFWMYWGMMIILLGGVYIIGKCTEPIPYILGCITGAIVSHSAIFIFKYTIYKKEHEQN